MMTTQKNILPCCFVPLRYMTLLCCLALIAACNDDTPPLLPARHTLLVYMAGDNNLSLETTQKIKAIAKGFHDSDNHLLVYQDYNHTSAGEQSTPLLLKLEATGVDTPARIDTLQHYPQENSASADVFARVLRQVAQQYPSASYGLLLFSHGTGWLPQGTFARPRSITTDGKNEMEVRDFAAAIPDGHFSYIVFEACLMAGVEVAYELRHKTSYLLASSAEIISPGFTPVYPELIPYLFESTPNLIGFARRFHTYADGLSGLYRSSTLSVIATQDIEDIARLVAPVLRQPHQPTPEVVQEFNRNAPLLYFDLGHYMQLAATDEQYRQFLQALDKVVIYQASTPQFVGIPVNHHSGLTVYLPQSKYPYLNAEYEKYQFINEK